MKKVVIIGGGVAGLSALNRLMDLGISAILIEAGDYPAHKICGEFFSTESLPILSAWNVMPSQKIDRISLVTKDHALTFALPISARSQSHFEFDEKLVSRARKNGAVILTNTKVKEIRKNEVVLENGELVSYTDLIISSGRFSGTSVPKYVGLKAYFKGIDVDSGLEMYPLPGGYAGLSPVGEGYANLTSLLPINITNPTKLYEFAPHLKRRLQNGEPAWDEWMSCMIPAFGIKKTPSQPNTYFIGDAAGTIPPASGLGLSIAITSGCMAAEYAAKSDGLEFKKAWHKKFKRVFTLGHTLHWLLTHPIATNCTMNLARLSPTLPLALFSKTRF